jgi:hypothetical protein
MFWNITLTFLLSVCILFPTQMLFRSETDEDRSVPNALMQAAKSTVSWLSGSSSVLLT